MNDVTLPFILTIGAGLSTAVGSLIFLFIKDFRRSVLNFFLGLAAGAMVYVSFMEMMPAAIREAGFARANLAFFAGIIFLGLVDFLVPHAYMGEKTGLSDGKLMSIGMMTAIGIAIHNFPEGMAVFMGSLGNAKLGGFLAAATALHNIPEGIAVAVPIYYATRSKRQAFTYSLLSGVAEPVGALITYLILRPFLSPGLMGLLFGFIAGIMVFISFDELLPSCFESREGHGAIAGLILGMAIMAVSLFFLL